MVWRISIRRTDKKYSNVIINIDIKHCHFKIKLKKITLNKCPYNLIFIIIRQILIAQKIAYFFQILSNVKFTSQLFLIKNNAFFLLFSKQWAWSSKRFFLTVLFKNIAPSPISYTFSSPNNAVSIYSNIILYRFDNILLNFSYTLYGLKYTSLS